jgi:hypothetical protein
MYGAWTPWWEKHFPNINTFEWRQTLPRQHFSIIPCRGRVCRGSVLVQFPTAVGKGTKTLPRHNPLAPVLKFLRRTLHSGPREPPLALVRNWTSAKEESFCTESFAPVCNPVHIAFSNRCKRLCFTNGVFFAVCLGTHDKTFLYRVPVIWQADHFPP